MNLKYYSICPNNLRIKYQLYRKSRKIKAFEKFVTAQLITTLKHSVTYSQKDCLSLKEYVVEAMTLAVARFSHCTHNSHTSVGEANFGFEVRKGSKLE